MSLDFTRLTDAFDYRLNKCWATSPDTGDSKLKLTFTQRYFSFIAMYILGDRTNDFKNGCSSRDWVTTGDQEFFSLPKGFTRPTSITFPVFTFGATPQLVVDCEVFLCTEAGIGPFGVIN